MKDLLVFVADADALAFLRAILSKPLALGIRPVNYGIERHPLRDAGMVQNGAELVRMKKGAYHKALLMWDHHGSGRDHKHSPEEVEIEIKGKLDAFTWRENCAVTVLVPELEQWLWYCESAMAAHCGVSLQQLQEWTQARAEALNKTTDFLKEQQPKELFEHFMRDRLRRTISPRDFEEIGRRAGIRNLLGCKSFSAIVETLRNWFPPLEVDPGEENS
jgi:hypothetical protein